MMLRMWFVLFAAVSMSACSDPGDALVVVQETNTPDQPPACGDYRHSYMVAVISECSGSRDIRICADEPLCENQLQAIAEPFRRCEQHSDYTIAIPDNCDD